MNFQIRQMFMIVGKLILIKDYFVVKSDYLKVLELEPTNQNAKKCFKIEELLKSDKKTSINCKKSMSLTR
jgi:hypothetical protein